MITVPSTVSAPPGGVWFWQDASHCIAGPRLDDVAVQVGRVLRGAGDRSDPVQAVLKYMAPRMPRGWAKGWKGSPEPTVGDYLARAAKVASLPVARPDVIKSRLARCARCKACIRPVCMPCLHIPDRVVSFFAGRRPPLPADAKSGVCRCAGTFCMAVCSVMYGADGDRWPDMPAGCWRNEQP